MLENYRDVVDSVALFTSATHPPLSLRETEIRMSVIQKRIQVIKALGFPCGINLLGTVGHHCEDLEFNLKNDYARIADINGKTCAGSFCMNDSRFLNEYIVPVYTMLAKVSPDFIWIDDDVRYIHMPLQNGCFCDKCIDIFNRKNGLNFTREMLKEALSEFNIPLRKKFLRHQSDTIIRLFELIGKTVRNITIRLFSVL